MSIPQLWAALQKHMEGLTNDVERSNELVVTIPIIRLLLSSLSIVISILSVSFVYSSFMEIQVIVLQEKLAEKDRELQILKETLEQPKSPIVEDDKADSPPTENLPKDEAMISGDAESWDQIDDIKIL